MKARRISHLCMVVALPSAIVTAVACWVKLALERGSCPPLFTEESLRGKTHWWQEATEGAKVFRSNSRCLAHDYVSWRDTIHS